MKNVINFITFCSIVVNTDSRLFQILAVQTHSIHLKNLIVHSLNSTVIKLFCVTPVNSVSEFFLNELNKFKESV